MNHMSHPIRRKRVERVQRTSMTPEDEDDLDEEIRRGFASMRRHLSACPPAERLIDFPDGTLSAEDRRAMVDHLEVCGTCDFLLERLTRAEEALRAGADAVSPADWRAVDRQLTREFEIASNWSNSTQETPQEPRGPVRWWIAIIRTAGAFLWRPAIGYIAALILCYPAYLGIRSALVRRGADLMPGAVHNVPREEPPVQRREPPAVAEALPAVQGVRSFDLSRTRGANQADGASAMSLNLNPEDRVFLLTFFIPSRPEMRYSVSVVASDGRIIVSEQNLDRGDQQGAFSVLCKRDSFDRGEYSLIVRETNPADGRVSRRFPFRFRL
jgi:hypothetical protein